ncbi:hypothetical protein [Paraburkholderia sp.]|uniref:hypothetical protein n=1 Tax=Paraburkholderia sp. TaxID=1926495 RepID=UPI0039E21EAF
MNKRKGWRTRGNEESLHAAHSMPLRGLCTRASRFWLGSLALVTACTSPTFNPHIPSSQQEAASVHVAVLSAGRWSEYESVLQPNMSVTIEQAENMALPVTSNYVRNVYDAFNGKLKVGWGKTNNVNGDGGDDQTGAAAPASGASSTDAGGGGGKGGKKSGKDSKGGAAGASEASAASPASAANGASAPAAASASDVGNAPIPSIESNPLLQHELALSIYQEMQILSRYLKDAAFKADWEPYVVRAQISVSPYAHYQPFDVYVDMGLFATCMTKHEQPKSPTNAAIAIPLLVTDSIEAQQASNTVQLARDLALGLGGNIGNVALQGDMEKITKNLQSILGMDYNSLYMVSRVTDSIMQVRFGAPANAQSQYSMSTVTHNVTLVVLTPRCKADHMQLNVATVSHLRNAVSGKVLDANDTYGLTEARKVLTRIVGPSFLTSPANNPKDIGDLVGAIRFGHYGTFLQTLKKACLPTDNAQVLWTALGDVGASSEFSVAYVDLPPANKGPLTQANQIVYLQDGATSSTATIGINPELLPVTQSAQLQLAGGKLVLAANSITPTNEGRTLQIQFPSLAPLKSMPGNVVPGKAGPLKGTLILQPATESWDGPTAAGATDGKFVFSSLLYMPTPEPPKNAATTTRKQPVHEPATRKKEPAAGGAAGAAAASAPTPPLPTQPVAPAHGAHDDVAPANHAAGHRKGEQLPDKAGATHDG